MHGKVLYLTALLAVAPLGAAASQDPGQRADSLAREVRLLKARLDSLERILAQLVAQRRDTAVLTDELAALRAAAQAAAGGAARDTATQQPSRTRNLSILNPEISVTGDIVANYARPAGEDDNVSATPREFEFSFQAALDPYTHTKIFITREQDFEIAGFPEEEGEAEEGGGFEIEEGYMYWVGLPGGLGLKLGKFRQEIGLFNRWHTHALLDVERSLAATAFLGEDGLIQTGGQLALPSLTTGAGTQTLLFEVARASNDALFAGGNELSYLGRVQSFWDLGPSGFVQLGATGVYGRNGDADLESKLLGLDVYYRWTPPGRALYRDVQLRAEWYVARQELGPATLDGNGGYGHVNYRLNRRWIVGARVDYVDAMGGGPDLFQIAPSLTFWQSEWVRLRLQYNYLKPEGGGGNHTVLFQTVWAVGPHKHESY